jgi:hypothetical protein
MPAAADMAGQLRVKTAVFVTGGLDDDHETAHV